MNRKPVIVVGGPTASGKSALALKLAERLGGDIVNSDSMQIYEDLPIVTARPDAEDERRVSHHLYGLLGMEERCSAGQWRDRALGVIGQIHDRGSVPVVVGGTGLYLKALMTGLHSMPTVPRDVRARLNRRLEENGAPALHAELSVSDPETAAGLNPADGQRLVRALEILEHTGRGLRSWQAGNTEDAPADLQFFSLVLLPPREQLYEAANDRFDRMLESGAVDEVADLLARSPADDFPLLKAVGVPPIRRFLDAEIDRERLQELGKRDTRRYAKRQMTWFRRQFIPQMTIETKYSEIKWDRIFSEIRRNLLTD